MKPAIEQIVSSDEVARATVEKAQRESSILIADAKKKAQKMLATLEEQIREAEGHEILPIISDARHQADLTLKQTEQYLERLRQKLALKKTKIIAAFVSNVVKMGMY